ncbi:MAG: hypothetical protein ACYCWW_00195 [Deltaproteobacteria bacterium]
MILPLGLASCQARLPVTPPTAAPLDAGSLATELIDAGPQILPGLTIAARWDGGGADLMAPDASVPAEATFEVTTAAQLDDARIRILDAEEQLRPNHLVVRRGDGGTSMTIVPTAPLPSKLCCRLAIDGETSAMPTDLGGHPFLPVERHFSVWPSPASSIRAPGRRRHHRRRQRR